MNTHRTRTATWANARLAIALVLTLLATACPAGEPTSTPPSSVPTTSGDGTPWFAPSAPWNRPVAELGRAPELQRYVERLWTHGGGAAPPGTISTAFRAYSVPVYDARTATTTARLYQTGWSAALYEFGLPLGTEVPWNPAWVPGTGNDNILVILDGDRVWEIGGVGQLAVNCATLPNLIAAWQHNDTVATGLCVSGAGTYAGLATHDGQGVDGRGAGLPKLALLTRADEVKAGAIRHVLELTVTATMFGPACTPANSAAAPGAGVSCGFFLPPANKLERLLPDIGCPDRQVVDDVERAKTVPEGMRFALDITDEQIEAWLDTRGYTGPLRSTARIFAVALRDYGWIVAETGCWGMHIETDSIIGPAGPTWADLGIAGDGSGYPHADLLNGLFDPERIYVVAVTS